jgi:AcrR family transcriptional regulator
MTKKSEKSEATRGALLAAARRLFTERGYASTPTEEIVRQAEVTRGALYHHFEDKRGLFLCVLEGLLQEVAMRTVDAATAAEGTAWERMQAGLEAYLRASLDPAVQQIVIQDGPAVLGWRDWGKVNSSYGLNLVGSALAKAIEEGVMKPASVETIAHLLSGAIGEGVSIVQHAEDRERALADVLESFGLLLDGLKNES